MAKEVVVYVTKSCPYCRAAKRFLADQGVAFREVDVTSDSEMRQKLVTMSGGRTTVPQIFADGESIGGYEDMVRLYETGHKLG